MDLPIATRVKERSQLFELEKANHAALSRLLISPEKTARASRSSPEEISLISNLTKHEKEENEQMPS